MSDETLTTMRRIPKQARSQQRVNLLLDTAAQVFAEVGFEAATTNLIAAQANVPIGSLYQFFPSKEAILDALAARYAEEMQRAMDDPVVEILPLEESISRLIDSLGMFEATHAGFKTLFAHTQLTDHMHSGIVNRVHGLLMRRFPALGSEKCRLGAMVSVSMVKGMMRLTEPPDNLPPDCLGVEIKTALVAYIRAFTAREGI
jgi:AcrR family transcriptional regulator